MAVSVGDCCAMSAIFRAKLAPFCHREIEVTSVCVKNRVVS